MRLVELLPGTRQEDIACRMYETLLDECAGSYEALSYVWGDASEKTPIQIDDQTLQIGTNLRLVLLNIRNLDQPRTLWIDALCINQADTAERNQQVAVMGEIYRRAKGTLVWLRDQLKKETSAAIPMLEELAEDAMSPSHGGSLYADGDGEDESIVHLNNLPASMIGRDGGTNPLIERYRTDMSALHILQSPWLYRAWTLQEILLAPRATIVIGRYSIDWDHLRVGANHGLNLGLWHPFVLGILPDPVLKPFLSLQSLKLKRRGQDPNESPGKILLELLFQCRFREATDPRDKIYSLLGLVANPTSHPPAEPTQVLPPLEINPDYSSPVNAIYAHAARQMMLDSNSLDTLGGCAQSINLLPSWVPHWDIPQSANPLVHDGLGKQRVTHATAHSKAWPRFADTTTLLLHAHDITTLVALAPPLPQPQANTTKVAEDSEKNFSNIKATATGNALSTRYLLVEQMMKTLGQIYEILMSVVPFLGVFADWEEFATAAPLTNPGPEVPGYGSRTVSPPSRPIATLLHNVRKLGISVTHDEEPEDRLAVYWQTLCTGTYDDTAAAAPERGRMIATQKLFYSWRASLKQIHDLHRWHADRKLRPIAFLGYVTNTWRGYGEFVRFIEGSYGRRLGRAANGYLCLVPANAEVGDKVVLARGGRVPLVMREQGGTGYWRLVGEAYIQGIMDGQAWDEGQCKEFKLG